MALPIEIPVNKLSDLNLEGEILWKDYTIIAYRFTHQITPNSLPPWVRRAINFFLQKRIKNAYCWYRYTDDSDNRVRAYVFDDDATLHEMLYYVITNSWEDDEKEQYRFIQMIAASFIDE